MKNSRKQEIDYSQYEGKEVTVIYDIDGEYKKFKAIITGIEYDIGISIEVVTPKQKEEKNLFWEDDNPYFFCIQGPMAPDYKYTASCRTDRYYEYFSAFVEMIEKGEISYKEDNLIRERLFGESDFEFRTMASCAFI